jgi:FG-GAP repeat
LPATSTATASSTWRPRTPERTRSPFASTRRSSARSPRSKGSSWPAQSERSAELIAASERSSASTRGSEGAASSRNSRGSVSCSRVAARSASWLAEDRDASEEAPRTHGLARPRQLGGRGGALWLAALVRAGEVQHDEVPAVGRDRRPERTEESTSCATSAPSRCSLNWGRGKFGAARAYPTEKAGDVNGAWSVAIGDLTGDGRTDLATATPGGRSVSVLVNRGGGTFQPSVIYALGPRALGRRDRRSQRGRHGRRGDRESEHGLHPPQPGRRHPW